MTAEIPKRRLRAVRAVPALSAEPDYRALVDAAGDIIYTLDFEGRFTFVNAAVMPVLGYRPTETLGTCFADYLTPESAQVALRHFAQGVDGGKQLVPFFEVEARRKDGAIVHLEVRAGSLHHQGILVGRQGVARDISELKALQASVSQRTALIEAQMRSALGLYARFADLAAMAPGEPLPSDPALLHVRDAVKHASADKIGLSTNDLGILDLLARGYSNREIAGEVRLSPHTVKDHVTRIMQRLGVRRRAEAVASALRLGLVSDKA